MPGGKDGDHGQRIGRAAMKTGGGRPGAVLTIFPDQF